MKPKRPLSIGFLYDDTLDSTDGVAQHVKTLGSWLSRRGHKVSYLVGETKMPAYQGGKVYTLAKNKVVTFNANRLSIPVMANRVEIKKVLEREHFDVLHVQAPYSPLMSEIVIRNANQSTAVVGTFHVYPANRLSVLGSRLLKLLLFRSLKRFDQIISVSQPARQFARDVFGLKSQIVPNVVGVASFNRDSSKSSISEIRRIVFLGRLVERKGCLQLLQAFALLRNNISDVELTIGGDGPQRSKLERFVIEKKLNNSVDFLGFVKEADKLRLLATADIASFPALYGESFGLVLVEAMAAGAKVVLGGNNPGYASVLDGPKEQLIDPTDTRAFAARLKKLLNDEPLAAKIHTWQQSAVKKYDVATVGPKIESIYRQAIANRAKSRHN